MLYPVKVHILKESSFLMCVNKKLDFILSEHRGQHAL